MPSIMKWVQCNKLATRWLAGAPGEWCHARARYWCPLSADEAFSSENSQTHLGEAKSILLSPHVPSIPATPAMLSTSLLNAPRVAGRRAGWHPRNGPSCPADYWEPHQWMPRGSIHTGHCPYGEVHPQISSSDSLVTNVPIKPLVTHKLCKSPPRAISPSRQSGQLLCWPRESFPTTFLMGAIMCQQSKSTWGLQIARDHLRTWPKCFLPLSTVNCKGT